MRVECRSEGGEGTSRERARGESRNRATDDKEVDLVRKTSLGAWTEGVEGVESRRVPQEGLSEVCFGVMGRGWESWLGDGRKVYDT